MYTKRCLKLPSSFHYVCLRLGSTCLYLLSHLASSCLLFLFCFFVCLVVLFSFNIEYFLSRRRSQFNVDIDHFLFISRPVGPLLSIKPTCKAMLTYTGFSFSPVDHDWLRRIERLTHSTVGMYVLSPMCPSHLDELWSRLAAPSPRHLLHLLPTSLQLSADISQGSFRKHPKLD